MNSYGDGNTYRGTVCKESQVPTIMTDGKTAYSGQDYPVHSSAPWKVNDFDNAVLFSRGDFEKVRLAIKLAMEG